MNSHEHSAVVYNNLMSAAARFHDLYMSTLLDDIVPFWMRHGFDEKFGGISNVLDESGNALNHEKFLWSQGRALWTFSALCNRVENKEEWRKFADHLFHYLSTQGRDERGYWMYRLDENGKVLDPDISIYVDGFALAGLTEYFTLTKNESAKTLALETYATIAKRLSTPGSYGTAPYEIPAGLKPHGVAMMYSFFFFNAGEAFDNADIKNHGGKLASEILADFYVPEKNAILEYVALTGEYSNTPAGRACVPGHAIEVLWFLISMAERSGDNKRIARCCELIERHLQLGWDEEFGGLKLALDINGQEPIYWQRADCKPWWVQVEALVATAMAYRHTGDEKFLKWHERIQSWAWDHYPVPGGEWTQWLDRSGKHTQSAALPVKDPFHLPRALMVLMETWQQIAEPRA